jgi:peptidase M28-like protein
LSPLARTVSVLLIAALGLVSCSDRAATSPAPAPAAAPGFDGGRAFRDLESLVQLGPRPSGSDGASRARALIAERLKQAGWHVETHGLQVTRPGGGKVDMVNLIARRSGATGPARTLVVTHYDTKSFSAFTFVGANDGASGAAVLLELARVTGGDARADPLALVFFDGEEAFGESINEEDGLYGSKALAQRMADDGSLKELRSVVLVDMVGDKDLNLALDLRSAPALRTAFERAAEKLGLPRPFDPAQALGVIDDHTPFQERGIEQTLALIDFQYGSRRSPGPRWHTADDTLEAVSADSLNRVGKTLVEFLMNGATAGGGP